MDEGGGGATAVRVRSLVGGMAMAAILLVGAAVALAIGVYARVHDPAGRPLLALGFSGMLPMKAWLTTAAVSLLAVQLVTALWMWGRLPAAGAAKMLALRTRSLPGWALPVMGGTVLGTLVLTWLTSALWFFRRSGLALV